MKTQLLEKMWQLIILFLLLLPCSTGFSQVEGREMEHHKSRTDSIPPVQEKKAPSYIDASYAGGEDSAELWLNENIQRFPDILSYFESQNLTKTLIKLSISSTGKPVYKQCLHKVTEKIDLSFSRLIETMPDWNPAQFEAENTSCVVGLILNLEQKKSP